MAIRTTTAAIRPATDDAAHRWPRFTANRLLEPRDAAAAGRLMLILIYLLAGLTLGFAVLSFVTTVSATPAWFIAVPVALLALGLQVHRSPPSPRSPVWIGLPLLGSTCIAALNLATNDASAAAQTFMFLPVIFAASHLHAPAAIIVTLFTAAANAVVAFSVLPSSHAITDAAYVSTLLVATAAVLVRAGQRQDDLVARLRELASIDPLTGLVTRRTFGERARAALRRPAGDGTALIVLDIDRFKDINDVHGHVVGDDALVHVSRLLAAHTRADSVISRLGGDELAVLLPRCGLSTARDRAAELVDVVRRSPLESTALAEPIALTVSAGVAHAPGDGTGLGDLYAAADEALYRAKRAGRDRVGHAPSFSPAGTARTEAVADPIDAAAQTG